MINNDRSSQISGILFVCMIIYFFITSLIPFSYLNINLLGVKLNHSIFILLTFLLCIPALLLEKKITRFDKWLLFLLAGFCLSLISSVDRQFTIRSVLSILFKGILIAFISSKIKELNREVFAKWVMLCAFIIAVLGITEYASEALTGVKFSPWAGNIIINSIQFYGNVVYDGYFRITASLGHPNIVGAFVVLILPLLLWYIKNSKYVFIGYVSLIIVVVVLFLTYSRFAYIAAVFSVVLYFTACSNMKNAATSILSTLLIVLVMGSMMYFLKADNTHKEKFLIYSIKRDIFESHRAGAYKTAYNIFKDYPIFGVGFGNYPEVHLKYKSEKSDKYMQNLDNMYLRLLAETGVTGLLAYLIFMFYWLYKFWQKRSDNFLLAIFSGLAGFMLNQLTVELLYWPSILFLSFMLLGIGVSQIERTDINNNIKL